MIDLMITLEAEDAYLRNLFKLYERIYAQVLIEKHRASKFLLFEF